MIYVRNYAYGILGKYLLVSCLLGKALRIVFEMQGLPSNSTCTLKAKYGKLDIKRQTWYSIYQFTHWCTLQTSDYGVFMCHLGINSKSATSSCPDKDTFCEIVSVYQANVKQYINMRGN